MRHSSTVELGRGATWALIVGSLLFLGSAARAGTATPCEEITSTTACMAGGCNIGMGCRQVGQACGCVPIGCCLFTEPSITCNGLMTQSECMESGGVFTPNAVCGSSTSCQLLPSPTSTPTSTPTVTGTVTPTGSLTATSTTTSTITPTRTETPVPNGGDCEESSQCASLVCEDGVCAAAPAPAMSPNALAVAISLLLGLGGLALWRMRRVR